MLQAFRVQNQDILEFAEWARNQGMEAIAEIPAKDTTVVALFRAVHPFTEREIAKSGLPVRQIKHPDFNFEVDDLDVLKDILNGADPFSFGIESVREFITDVLNEARPVTVHSKRENRNYVIFPGFPNKDAWRFAAV